MKGEGWKARRNNPLTVKSSRILAANSPGQSNSIQSAPHPAAAVEYGGTVEGGARFGGVPAAGDGG